MFYIAQSLVAVNDMACTLNWSPSLAGDTKGYNVYMSINDDQNFKKQNQNLLLETTFKSRDLRRDHRYYFYVTAVDFSGNESVPSATVEFILPDGAYDPTVIEVPRPVKVPLPAGDTLHLTTYQPDLMTLFRIDSFYLDYKRDVAVAAAQKVTESISVSDILTIFTIGG